MRTHGRKKNRRHRWNCMLEPQRGEELRQLCHICAEVRTTSSDGKMLSVLSSWIPPGSFAENRLLVLFAWPQSSSSISHEKSRWEQQDLQLPPPQTPQHLRKHQNPHHHQAPGQHTPKDLKSSAAKRSAERFRRRHLCGIHQHPSAPRKKEASPAPCSETQTRTTSSGTAASPCSRGAGTSTATRPTPGRTKGSAPTATARPCRPAAGAPGPTRPAAASSRGRQTKENRQSRPRRWTARECLAGLDTPDNDAHTPPGSNQHTPNEKGGRGGGGGADSPSPAQVNPPGPIEMNTPGR